MMVSMNMGPSSQPMTGSGNRSVTIMKQKQNHVLGIMQFESETLDGVFSGRATSDDVMDTDSQNEVGLPDRFLRPRRKSSVGKIKYNVKLGLKLVEPAEGFGTGRPKLRVIVQRGRVKKMAPRL